MKEHKNIDRLFQEKFRDFESIPPERIWNKLENKMNGMPDKSNQSSWIWLSSIAAGLFLLFWLNNPFQLPENPFNSVQPEMPVVEVETLESIEEQTLTEPFSDQQFSTTKTNKTNSFDLLNFKKVTADLGPKYNSKITLSRSVIELKMKESNDEVWVVTQDIPMFLAEDVLSKNSNSSSFFNSDKSTKKWSVSTIAAPVFLSSFNNKTSALDAQMDENEKQGQISKSIGVQVAYQINKRFSLQSGVHLVDFAYRTQDIFVSPSGSITKYDNVTYTSDAKLHDANVSQLSKSGGGKDIIPETGDLTQVYGYIEIPLEAKYRLNSQGDFGMNLIGGFSTLLLNKNDIYVETNTSIDKIGESSNLNSLNFSGNIGVEFEYKVYKNVNFNLIPMFKVQTHTLNNTNTFAPYSVGLYSGLNLRF